MPNENGLSQLPLVVFSDITDLDPAPAEKILSENGYATMRLDLGNTKIVPVEAQRASGMIVGYADIDDQILTQFPQLKVAATCSAGTDMVDKTAARQHGVSVVNLPGVATEEVAEHALSLILASERGLVDFSAVVSSGKWTEDATWLPRRISSLTLGLIGFGKIGQHLAHLAAPLFGEIIAYDPYFTGKSSTEIVELEELQHRSDIISLHLPLTEDTKGIVSEQFLSHLRTGAVLVNVSRGELVDDNAVRAALTGNSLRFYAADVLVGDPPAPSDPLRTEPKTLITPHIAFLSEQSKRSYEEEPARNVISVLAGTRKTTREQVW